MTAEALLADLRARGVRVVAKGTDTLRLEAPPGSVGREDLECLRALKSVVLELLRRAALPSQSLTDAPIVEVRDRLGAVRIRSQRFGEVWLAMDNDTARELRAEESERDLPRPILLPDDVYGLHAIPPEALAAVLEILAVFPGARVVQ